MRPYGYIYLITNTVNGKHYVGQTRNTIKHRWWNHCNDNRHFCRKLANSINKHGPACFLVEEVFQCNNPDELNLLENACIIALMSHVHGYNLNTGGNYRTPTDETRKKTSLALKGRRVSTETRQRMSDSLKGRTYSAETLARMRLGAKHRPPVTEEFRKRMSIITTGRTHSEETAAKISAAHKGRPKSPEHKRKLAIANTGKKASQETRKKMAAAWTPDRKWSPEVLAKRGRSYSETMKQRRDARQLNEMTLIKPCYQGSINITDS